MLIYKSGLRKLSKNQLSFTLNVLGTCSSDGLVGSFNVLALYTWEYVPSEFLTVAEFSSKPAKDFTLLFNLWISPFIYPYEGIFTVVGNPFSSNICIVTVSLVEVATSFNPFIISNELDCSLKN